MIVVAARTSVLLLLLTAVACQETLEYSNSFENGAFITSPVGSSERGIITGCSGATASVNAASASVPVHSGSYAAVLALKAQCAVSHLEWFIAAAAVVARMAGDLHPSSAVGRNTVAS